MNERERLHRGLKHTREFTDKVLADIAEEQDWVRCPVPGSNHALWIAGHLSVATNSFIGWVNSSEKIDLGHYASLFGKGSEPVDDLKTYPKPSEVTQHLRERGNTFSQLLLDTEEHDMGREIAEGPDFMPDIGSIFQMAIWHESLHAGQLSVIHRMIGRSAFTARAAN